MVRKRKRFLSLALAAALAASLPTQGITAKATEPGTIEAVDDDANAPAKPDLPAQFYHALEDNGGLTLAGLSTSQTVDFETMLTQSVQWNNANQYHATVTNTDALTSGSFTVLFDVRQDPPSGDTDRVDQRSAFNIGNSSNNLHLLTYSGKFGYGSDSGGVSSNHKDVAAAVEKDGWNAVAMTYEENNGQNGSVKLYINGKKACEVADVGFKLSAMDGLSAMIARSFNTNYL